MCMRERKRRERREGVKSERGKMDMEGNVRGEKGKERGKFD